jgi:hypothetical protein
VSVTAESVTVEIIAKLAKAKADVKDMDATFTSSTNNMQRSAKQLEGHLDQLARNSTSSFDRLGTGAKRAADDIDKSAGRIANARRNIGRQVADVGAQASGGQNPALIFAQQAPQIADALADVGGTAGRVASFFAGPWGAAILAAGSILGTVLIPRLLEGGDAADTMSKAQIDLARFVDTTTGAINRQTTAVQRLAAAQARQGDIESGTKSYAQSRNATITSVQKAAGIIDTTPVYTAGGVTVPKQQDTIDPIKKRLRELAAEAVRTRQPINDFALAVRQAVGDRPEYKSLVKTITASAAATVTYAQGVQRLKAEQAVLTGTATAQQKALLGIGQATTGLVEKQVALATATSTLEKARARLALVQERGRSVQAGDGKALDQYRADLTKAQTAVNSAEAAEKSAAQSKRNHAKATREAAKAERERLKDIRDTARAERELLGLRSDLLSSKSDLTSDTRLQDEFSRQRIKLDQQGQVGRLDEQKDRGDLAQAEYDARKKLIDEITQNRLDLVNRNESIRYANEELETAQAQVGHQRDILQAQEQLARTTADRRAIELKLLDLGLEEQRLTAQKVLDLAAVGKASPQDAALAQGTLDALPALRQYGEATIRRNNQAPIASYLDRIPREGEEINEAFEGIAVNGIERVNDGLATAASNFLKLRGVAGEAISGIIADLARLALQRGILSLLGSFLPGGGGLTAVASPFAGDGAGPSTFTPSYSGLPRLATGGTILAGGAGGVDKNVLSVNGVPKAMIGAHETLSVANPNLSVGANMQVARPAPTNFTVQQTVHVDARNSVNPQGFARELLSQANSYAVQVGHQAVKQSLEAMPGSLSSHVRLRG